MYLYVCVGATGASCELAFIPVACLVTLFLFYHLSLSCVISYSIMCKSKSKNKKVLWSCELYQFTYDHIYRIFNVNMEYLTHNSVGVVISSGFKLKWMKINYLIWDAFTLLFCQLFHVPLLHPSLSWWLFLSSCNRSSSEWLSAGRGDEAFRWIPREFIFAYCRHNAIPNLTISSLYDATRAFLFVCWHGDDSRRPDIKIQNPSCGGS